MQRPDPTENAPARRARNARSLRRVTTWRGIIAAGRSIAIAAAGLAGCAAIVAGAPPVRAQAAPSIALRGPFHFADRSADLPDEPVTAIAVDPNDPDVAYAGFDGFVFQTDDGGESWRPVLSFPRGPLDDTAIDDNGAGAARTRGAGGLDLGDDAGADDDMPDGSLDVRASVGASDDMPDGSDDIATARAAGDVPVVDAGFAVPRRSEPGVRQIAFVVGRKGLLYVATSRGLWRSTTGGRDFASIRLPGGTAANDIRDIAVDPRRASRLYVATADGVFISRDGGMSFDANRETAHIGILALAVDDLPDEVQVLAAAETGLMRSRNAGGAFQAMLLQGLPLASAVHSVAYERATGTIYAGTPIGLYVARRDAPILERAAGPDEEPVEAISVDPTIARTVALGTTRRGVVFSEDAGESLVRVDNVAAVEVVSLARDTRKHDRVWAATDRGVFRLEPGTGVAVVPDMMRGLRRRWEAEPDLASVTERALVAHGLGHKQLDIDDVMRRAGLAKLLPRLDAKWNVVTGDTQAQRATFVFRDPSVLPPFVDPQNDDIDLLGSGALVFSPTIKTEHTFWATLSWDLDHVVLNPDALAAARQLPTWTTARERIADRVRELYLTRRRLAAEIALTPQRSGEAALRERVRLELKFSEVEAQLTALAGAPLFAEEP